MASGKNQSRRELLRLRRAMAQVERQLADLDRLVLGPHHLCASDLEILERLVRKGTRPVNGLANRVGLTSGSITTAVQRLKRRGLVQTQRDPQDKRLVLVSVTTEGRDLATELTERRTEVLEQAFRTWNRRERSVELNLLKRLQRHIRALPAPGDAPTDTGS